MRLRHLLVGALLVALQLLTQQPRLAHAGCGSLGCAYYYFPPHYGSADYTQLR